MNPVLIEVAQCSGASCEVAEDAAVVEVDGDEACFLHSDVCVEDLCNQVSTSRTGSWRNRAIALWGCLRLSVLGTVAWYRSRPSNHG